MEMEIIPPEHYNLIWRVSWICFFNSLYAAYNKYYDLSLALGSIFLTSINYWRKPDYSWRRYLDIIVVQLGFMYQLTKAYNSEYSLIYYSFTFSGITMFFVGVYYYNKNEEKYLWRSTMCHISLHVLANIGNVILYSGRIENL